MPSGELEDLKQAVRDYLQIEQRLFRTNEPMAQWEFDAAVETFNKARGRLFDLAVPPELQKVPA